MNIRTMINRLIESGMSQTQIGEQVGVMQSTVSRLSSGDIIDTSYRTAKAIEKLYSDRCKNGKR